MAVLTVKVERATVAAAMILSSGARSSPSDEADRDGHGPVAEEVAFHTERRHVFGLKIFGARCDRVAEGRPADQVERVVVHGRLAGFDQLRHPAVEPPQVEAGARGSRIGLPRPESDEIVRAAGLRAGADGRALPPAERLALHDRTGDAAVHVEVACLDGVEPVCELARIERVEPCRQTVFDGVLVADRLVEVARGHDAENGPEEFGEVEVRAGLRLPCGCRATRVGRCRRADAAARATPRSPRGW